MGNSVSYCKEEPAVRVKEALSGESTEERGSDASDDATSPADTAPAVPMEPATAGAEAEHAAGDLMERAKETMVSAKEAAESAMETAVDRAHLRKGSQEGDLFCAAPWISGRHSWPGPHILSAVCHRG